jgi:sulfite dehydrogenase (cytochrome) subunit B
MRHWQRICALTSLAIVVTSLAAQSQPPATTASSQVERITLPDYSGQIPKGPNMQVYENDCLICHSARYVTTQPGFSRSTWEKEVKKMIDSYGATVPDDDQRKIVEYLVAVRGAPDSK